MKISLFQNAEKDFIISLIVDTEFGDSAPVRLARNKVEELAKQEAIRKCENLLFLIQTAKVEKIDKLPKKKNNEDN
jgi:hypothetical protein